GNEMGSASLRPRISSALPLCRKPVAREIADTPHVLIVRPRPNGPLGIRGIEIDALPAGGASCCDPPRLSRCRPPMALEIGDQPFTEVTVRLLCCVERHISSKEI